MKIYIEGDDAELAGEELAALEGVDAQVETPKKTDTRTFSLAAAASIVAILGGSAALAEQLRSWHAKWKGEESGSFKAVIELDDGSRISLDDASPDQIADVLKALKKD